MTTKFRHLKTGNIYEMVRDDVINCTNANDEQIMVLYKRADKPDLIFVREKEEFYQKFEKIED
jgi:hypothetical protein